MTVNKPIYTKEQLQKIADEFTSESQDVPSDYFKTPRSHSEMLESATEHNRVSGCKRMSANVSEREQIKATSQRGVSMDVSPTPINALIADFINENEGEFITRDIDNEFSLCTRYEKNARSTALNRLARLGKIKKVKGKIGRWKIIKGGITKMGLKPTSGKPLEIPLPLCLSDLATINRGNIVLVAGAPNAGKTAFLLTSLYTLLKETKKKNQKEKKKEELTAIEKLVSNGVRYLNSEMDEDELVDRITIYPDGYDVFSEGCEFIQRYRDFADVLIPDGINFIDFLEIHEDFFELGKLINEIHEELNGGICFVAVQKKQGADYAKGGAASLEKPRLVLNLDRNEAWGQTCKIVKCKRPAVAGENHDGKECDFGISGYKLKRYSNFRYVAEKERIAINNEYKRDGVSEIPEKKYAFLFSCKDGSKKGVLDDIVDRWQESYPAINVRDELRIIESESRRKPWLDPRNYVFQIPAKLEKIPLKR